MKTLRVNMSQMNKWSVDQDNIRFFDNIHKSKGVVVALDYRGYTDFLNEFNIFYTLG